MYAYQIPLSTRAHGRHIISAESDLPFMTNVSKGCTVTLRAEDVRIMADVIEVDENQSFLGQVTDIDGFQDPTVFEGMRIGSYVRFEEKHIFTCSY